MLEDDRNFEPDRKLTLSSRMGERPVEVEYFRRQHGRYVLKIKGIDSIEQAEQIIGGEIRILRSELQPQKEGSFYTFQLKGCRVFSDGEDIGIVTDVLDIGATEILKVDLDGSETLIPFARSYMKKIDLEQQRIDVDLPEGLRELNK
jgi:16S rRNA processing protein RimM